MANPYFRFKQFTIYHDQCAMKVTTDACLFGAWVAMEMKEQNKEMNALDIGSGTGLLSLMVAQKNNVYIKAVEIDRHAADQSQFNINTSPWNDKIQLIHDDILQVKHSKSYDVIISNPPFYERELASEKVEKNIAHHSAALNLVQVLEIIQNQLYQDGTFYLLLPYKRDLEIEELIKNFNLFILKKVIVAPSSQHDPFRIMVKGSKLMNSSKQVTKLDIWDENQQYTETFTHLLRDYYLYL